MIGIEPDPALWLLIFQSALCQLCSRRRSMLLATAHGSASLIEELELVEMLQMADKVGERIDGTGECLNLLGFECLAQGEIAFEIGNALLHVLENSRHTSSMILSEEISAPLYTCELRQVEQTIMTIL